MTSKLTRDRLQEIAEDGFLKHGESKELARMALAAMESEPVAWIHEDELPDGYPYDSMFPFSKVDIVRMFPVFSPQPPLVPDELLNEIDDLLSVCRVYACRSRRNGSENDIPRTEKAQNWLRSCRAAMLNGGKS